MKIISTDNYIKIEVDGSVHLLQKGALNASISSDKVKLNGAGAFGIAPYEGVSVPFSELEINGSNATPDNVIGLLQTALF
jgi:hypothetical protein